MISYNDNQEKVNSRLMELNKKHIPKNDIILNTSPPRVGKTISTILYHIENKIPAIVFIDNKQQAEDIQDDITKINKEYESSLYHWKSKEKLCYILSNEVEIIGNEGQEFFETFIFKNKNGINSCNGCKYYNNCDWAYQKDSAMGPDVMLMNKKNIETPLVNSSLHYDYSEALFYKYDYHESIDGYIEESVGSRTIIYDEKLEALHEEKFNELDINEINLLNKIFELKISSSKIRVYDNSDFIKEIKTIKELYSKKSLFFDILNEVDFDFRIFGEFEEKFYLEILFNKISNNIRILDYLDNKNAQLPKTKGGKYDLKYITYEKLYIDILFEKKDNHKIILLDATPLKIIVDNIKTMDGFKEIKLGLDIFDEKSTLLRIDRRKKHVITSRQNIISRNEGKKIESIIEDESYIPVLETGKFIKESENPEKIKFGVISYNSLKIKNDENEYIEFKPLEELEKVLGRDLVHTLYFGNSRGRSELNECDILYVVGTDRHPPFSRYNLYRYLGGSKTPTELKAKDGFVDKLTFNDALFNQIINHQIDSEMEQVIFRNMPHIKKRLIILEGHFPEHLTKYFKEIPSINMKEHWRKIYFPKVINHFIETIFSGELFNFKDVKKHPKLDKHYVENIKRIMKLSYERTREIKREIKAITKKEQSKNRDEILKLAKKYDSNPYKSKYNYTLKAIYQYLEKEHDNLMKKAKINSYGTFARLYSEKYSKK